MNVKITLLAATAAALLYLPPQGHHHRLLQHPGVADRPDRHEGNRRQRDQHLLPVPRVLHPSPVRRHRTILRRYLLLGLDPVRTDRQGLLLLLRRCTPLDCRAVLQWRLRTNSLQSSYNLINLPAQIKSGSTVKANYSYLSDGTKTKALNASSVGRFLGTSVNQYLWNGKEKE